MNKKILIFATALLAVAMLATPLFGTAQACGWRRPFATKTLTGSYYIYPESTQFDWGPYATVYPESAHTYSPGEDFVIVWKDVPVEWTGDIAGCGTYSGVWFVNDFFTEDGETKAYGIFVIDDAEVEGVGTGKLVIYGEAYTVGLVDVYNSIRVLWGTGDLRGIKGSGTSVVDPTSMGKIYDYTMEVKIRT